MASRTIAIGDVHGCSQALEALVTAIEPQRDDVIVALGDYINRGPNTQGTIEQMLLLEERCTLVPLLGNHDQMLLDALAGRPQSFSIWMRLGGGTTLLSYGASPGTVTGAALVRIPDEHIAFLKRCRDYYESNSHIFVHAKYAPDLPMSRQPAWLLRWESLHDGTPGPHASGKVIIAGHSSQKSGEILDLGHLICIDTYCYGGGWLTALDVQCGQVWQANQQGKLRGP
jgi:serine/threonine protein phosphatase 1